MKEKTGLAAIAEKNRQEFLREGETFEGYFLRHLDGSNRPEEINYLSFTDNPYAEKTYRISSEQEFILDLAPEKTLTAEEYVRFQMGQDYSGGVEAYAVYSTPKTDEEIKLMKESLGK